MVCAFKRGVALSVIGGWLSLAPFLTSTASAEFYVAAQGGTTIPAQYKGVEGQGAAGRINLGNLALQSNFLYGVKAGYFLPSPQKADWLGVEVEAFTATPNVKQQTVNGTIQGTAFSSTVPGASLRVTTFVLNVIARYPHERFQPYIGAGIGMFWARASDSGGSSSDVTAGFNGLGGLRVFLTKSVALFGEYKYNRASFQFNRLGSVIVPGLSTAVNGNYEAQIIVGGLSLHF
jgi:opacity protein-like surface antigen